MFLITRFAVNEDSTDLKTGINYMRSCPSPKKLFPETVRRPLRDLVSGVCPILPAAKRISALEFRVCVLVTSI